MKEIVEMKQCSLAEENRKNLEILKERYDMCLLIPFFSPSVHHLKNGTTFSHRNAEYLCLTILHKFSVWSD